MSSQAIVLAAVLAVIAIIVVLMSRRPCHQREPYEPIPPGAKQAEDRANRILNGYMEV